MKYSNWNISGYDSALVDELQAGGVPFLPSAVLACRGVASASAAISFINEDHDCFRDPMTLPDMPQAVERVRLAQQRDELVAIYGDYDVDGITALSLMLRGFKSQSIRCTGYIPDRIDEGYGLNAEAIEHLHGLGVTLIITVDCGITAVDEVAFAASLGIDVIITDHHECKDVLPDAVAVVDPRRPDCDYSFKEFAGVGVAYKLLSALFGEDNRRFEAELYAPLVAIGTVADVMPLVDENRVIVRYGLDCIRSTPIVGLQQLLHSAGLGENGLTTANIGFILAPRINAAGRMGRARVAVDLLLTEDKAEAKRLADELCALNRERQQVENEIFKQTRVRVQEECKVGGAAVLAGEGWHQGVIGIVASRVAEKCCAPAFLISLDGDIGKASCRSYGGFNLFHALEQTDDLLESFGGHALAAGFTIRRENIAPFRARMDELFREYSQGRVIEPVLRVDCELEDAAVLSLENVDSLRILEPFGSGNPSPVFCINDMEVLSATDVGGGKHLKLTLAKDGRNYDGIFFSNTALGMGIASGDMVDVAFCPGINEFRGHSSVQLVVNDIRQNLETRRKEQKGLELFEKYRSGAELTREEALALLPPRESFVAIWRYLKSHAEDGCTHGEKAYLSRVIARVAGLPPDVVRMLVCLDVFKEMELIDLLEYGSGIFISLRQVSGKVDLNQSQTIKKLRKLAGR